MKTLEILSDKDLMKQIEVANGLRSPNMVVVVWETWLNSGAEAEGLGLTRQIWSDMQRFDGYISHQLLVDHDAPSHLLVVSQWRSREVADRIKEEYAGSEMVRQLKPLLAHERGRWVYSEDKPSE